MFTKLINQNGPKHKKSIKALLKQMQTGCGTKSVQNNALKLEPINMNNRHRNLFLNKINKNKNI